MRNPKRFAIFASPVILAAGFLLVNREDTTAADEPAPKATNPGPSDHTMFGGTKSRNMVNLVDKKIPAVPLEAKMMVPDPKDPEKKKTIEKIIPADGVVLWKADLGSRAYGGPTVAGGRVYCGTNNQRPRNDRDVTRNKEGEIEPIDRGVLMCFDEKTGKFLWQAVHNKLESGRVNDWPEEGVCATPTVEGDFVYYVSNRCTVTCLDANGFANGNQGFQGEKYQDATDGDIIWQYDMMKELGVFPHNMSAGCPLIIGDILFVHTANGVDDGHLNLPSPNAPSFIALDKKTGKLLWKSSLPGKNIMHGQWSNPTFAEIDGVRQVLFGGGDGWIYSFVPETGELIWKFDGNPKDSVYELGGTGTRSDYIGTPVIYDNKIYIGLGQDPEHSTGISHFWCIAPKKDKKGDISKFLETKTKGPDGKDVIGEKPNPNSCAVWHFGGDESRSWAQRDFKFGRTMSSACIVDDVLYISELAGFLHCMNAQTGEHYWKFDTKASIWGSAYFVDGKVYLANDAGDLFVFRHDKKPVKIDELDIKADNMKEARKQILEKKRQVAEKYLIAKVELDAPIRSTPVVANGVLFVMSEKTLYAFKEKK
ncbi:MAG: PQQ-binding-like beta-propeller repeat protein [Planctomycetes bacterium]|nr:PQQ-binding-like beta-propeller repeat protein [Planctomycetota bacterium]